MCTPLRRAIADGPACRKSLMSRVVVHLVLDAVTVEVLVWVVVLPLLDLVTEEVLVWVVVLPQWAWSRWWCWS